MVAVTPEAVATDLAKLISPGLRSPRADLTVLPAMAVVQSELARGARSITDAIEAVVNHALETMAAGTDTRDRPRLTADPVKALRAALAMRPGTDRVKSRTRRTAAAQAMGLLSGDGWRAHHEKPLLLELATTICALEDGLPATESTPATTAGDSGIARFYSDFVDIEHDWEDLFVESFTLDLAIMYGATWRNTYRKNLSALAQRPDGRIRIILPEPAPDSMLIDTYAHSLRITSDDLRRKINEAISDFKSLEPRRHIEVYLTSALFRHAIYVFTHRAVVAMYALCGERIATPALLASEGGLLNFVRLDFDRLLEQSKRIS